jgi:hypothetical protein
MVWDWFAQLTALRVEGHLLYGCSADVLYERLPPL